MILKCATVILLVNVIITQAQNNSTDLEVLNSVFFQKFFKEFQKQYEELQRSKKVTTLPPPTSYESSTIQANISSVSQNNQNTNISTEKTSNRPSLNPLNPYFTISPDSIRPTRRPHVNPFLRRRSTTQATTVPHTTIIDLSTEKGDHILYGKGQTVEARFQEVTSEKVGTTTDLLSHFQTVTTLPPKTTLYESSSIDTNISSDLQNIETANINNRKTSRRPTLNPVNPYFTIAPDSIRPTRRPHTNPWFKIRTTTQSPTLPQKTVVDVSTEENKHNVSEKGQSLIERFEQVTGEKLDTKTDFLSFVQSALAATPKQQQEISTNQLKSTQSVSNLVKKLVKIVPKMKIEVQPKAEPEFELRPRGDVFTTKPKTRNDYQNDESKIQNQNAKYTFASDVKDTINGNVHQRHEQREGNKVTGMYTYEDGFFRRTVHYEADENGYRVVKEDVQEIGNGPLINPDGSAKVKAYVAGNVVDYQWSSILNTEENSPTLKKNMEYIVFIILVCALCYKCEETSDNYETRKTTVNFMIDELKRQVDMDNSFNYRVLRPPNIESEYDFIIIGSGSAGSVIANRLSEVEKWKILLLEVGREATGFSDIPQLAPALQFTDLNWGYLMEKQEGVALGLVDQRMAWPRGRALGGSSVINYMLNVRGNREDYNRWERMGNPGWSYRDVFQYFVKSEDASIAVNDTGYHAKGGYLSVQDVPYRTESAHAWVRACQEAGYKYVDYNGRQQLGVSYVQGTINNGRRCSVEKAFLRTAKDRPNLTILTEAWVTKILIDDENKQAYGVQYVKNGQYYTVRAKNEVILSAGTFNSPQLLMLSGIGPKKHLEELGIPVLQDLPVGQKMYDHLTFLGLIFTVNDSITTKTEDIFSINSFLQWKTFGEGPHTGLGGVEAFTYIKTENNTQRKSPDVELIFVGLSLGVDAGALIRKTFRITDYHFKQYWGPLIGRPAFQVLPMLLFRNHSGI
ncbi:hypothetical protein WA026_015238 [Henosepilachna vigintioctopunctata]|uniref:Glucose-methanol-choline oxidoreductase N-terminal domain-containing protein n=1 Tax=Henosepilachna vigintioctopunctata TaxID=420089 RepID=A0AAW1TTI5_9CUCU